MVKDNSAELYLKSYIALVKKVGSDDPSAMKAYINNLPLKDRTKHNYYNAIVSLHKHYPHLVNGDISEIKTERDKLQKAINKAVKTDNITAKQREVMEKVDWADIETLMHKLKADKDSDKVALEEYVLLELMNPPLRNDLQEVRVSRLKADCKDNCIFLPKGKGAAVLYIRDHKTTSRGGKPIIRRLSDELGKDIRELVKDGRTHLFVDRAGLPFTSSAFTHKLNKLFTKHLNQPISSTLLRKLYLTSKYGDVKKRATEMKKDAEQMGHSVETQQTNYVGDD